MRGQGGPRAGIRWRPPAAGGDGPARPSGLDLQRDLAASPSTDLDDLGDPVRPQVGGVAERFLTLPLTQSVKS